MKIELQEPYASLFTTGNLYLSSDGRKRIYLSNNITKQTTGTSYARYLMSVKLGYIVPDEFEVDHRDNDKTNDDIDNLQLLTPEQNRLKEQYRYVTEQQISFGYECAYCGNSFILIERLVKMRLAQNVEHAFCSKSCSTSFHIDNGNITPTKQIPEADQQRIKSLRSQGLSVYKIADLTGYARNTVMKYWN